MKINNSNMQTYNTYNSEKFEAIVNKINFTNIEESINIENHNLLFNNTDINNFQNNVQNNQNSENLENNTPSLRNIIMSETVSNSSNSSNTIINGMNFIMFYENGEYNVTLTDRNNTPLANKVIVMSIMNVSYNRITNENGTATLPIRLIPKQYNITSFFAGDENYDPAMISNIFEVLPTIYAEDLTKSYLNQTQFYAMLFNNRNGEKITNSYALISIKKEGSNNTVTYNRPIDSFGLAMLQINLLPSHYDITVTNPNDNLQMKYHLTVLPQNLIITCNNLKTNHKGEYYYAKVTDMQGSPINGLQVNFNVVGHSYSKITNEDGIALLPINLNPGNYPIYLTVQGITGYNDYRSTTKTITVISSNTKLNVNLYSNDTSFKSKGNYFKITLKDNNDYTMANQNITFTLNGIIYTSITDITGTAKICINLTDGNYTITSSFAGNLYYNSKQITNHINVNLTPNFVYSVEIPMYYNMSGVGYVSTNYIPEKYISQEGANGIVKVYQSREFAIRTGNIDTYFVYSPNYYNYTFPGKITVNQGDHYFISREGNVSLIDSNYRPQNSGILFKAEQDWIKFYYYDAIDMEDITQFSTVYSLDFNMFPITIQLIHFVKNFDQWGGIFITQSLVGDDIGLRLQLSHGHLYYKNKYLPYVTYSEFLEDYPDLRFTNVHPYSDNNITFSEDDLFITNGPHMEYFITSFNMNEEKVIKKETMSYNIMYDFEAGYNAMQTYLITDKKVNEDHLNEFIKMNDENSYGYQKAIYGTFLNDLITFWMSDSLADEKAEIYNLTWNRNKKTVVMSGINYGGNSYIHIPNPSMNMDITGTNQENILNFRLECSASLSEIESIVLDLSNKKSTSSIDIITEYLFNCEYFRVEQHNDTIVLRFKDYNEKIIINQTTGIVSFITELDDFLYKGAITNDYCYCYCFDLTNHLTSNTKKVYEIYKSSGKQSYIKKTHGSNKFLGLSEKQWDETFGLAGSILVQTSYPMMMYGGGTIFSYVGVGFFAAGFVCNCLAEDMDEGITWRKFERARLKTGVGLAGEALNIAIPPV